MTLPALPAWNWVIDSTALSSGSVRRATMDCSASTMWLPTTTGSMLRCGRAAWPPWPVMRIQNRSDAAVTEPATAVIVPTGRVVSLWAPNTMSQGKRWNSPSSTMTRPPPPPSSAGWKMKWTVPSKLRGFGKILGGAQQHRGVTVMAAGVHRPCVQTAMFEIIRLLHRQRVHIGANADRALRCAAAQRSNQAGGGDAAGHFDAPGFQLGCDQVAGTVLPEAEFRMRVDVAPPLGQFIGAGGDAVDHGHVVRVSGRLCGEAPAAVAAAGAIRVSRRRDSRACQHRRRCGEGCCRRWRSGRSRWGSQSPADSVAPCR